MKITDLQAACGLAQLDRLGDFIRIRNDNFNKLLSRFSSMSEFFILPEATVGSDPSWFGFPVSLKTDSGLNREDLMRYLEQERVGTRLVFAGNLTKQPYLYGRNDQYRVAGELTATNHVMKHSFWLGVYPGLTSKHIDYVCDKVEEFLGIGF